MLKYLVTLLFVTASLSLGACGGDKSVPAENIGAEWNLQSKSSNIHYVTIKQGDIAENNSFSIFTGTVAPSGKVEINIALNSINTQIDTRDMRMKKIVFKTSDYPLATIRANIPMTELDIMEIGERKTLQTEIKVSLVGMSELFDANFLVTRIGANRVLVESKEPIMVQTSDFGFVESVAELQRLAKLDSITPVVPVSFSLVFER